MTKAKNEVFVGLQHENCYLVGGSLWRWGDKNLEEESTGGIFLG